MGLKVFQSAVIQFKSVEKRFAQMQKGMTLYGQFIYWHSVLNNRGKTLKEKEIEFFWSICQNIQCYAMPGRSVFTKAFCFLSLFHLLIVLGFFVVQQTIIKKLEITSNTILFLIREYLEDRNEKRGETNR